MTAGGTLAVIIPVLVAMLGSTTIVANVLAGRIDQLARNVDARFDQSDRAVNARFDDVGERIDRVESRMGRLETRQDETLERLGGIDVHIKVLEQRQP